MVEAELVSRSIVCSLRLSDEDSVLDAENIFNAIRYQESIGSALLISYAIE